MMRSKSLVHWGSVGNQGLHNVPTNTAQSIKTPPEWQDDPKGVENCTGFG
jgi:hypothetical protein